MRSWSPNIQSQYVIFLFLLLLAGLTSEMRAGAQTVTMTDSAVIGSNARPGLNLGQPSGSYPFFKNYLAFGNPGFEPMIDQQIYQFQAPQAVSSPTSFQWNVNNTQYSSYDANQWAGATFTVIQGSYASENRIPPSAALAQSSRAPIKGAQAPSLSSTLRPTRDPAVARVILVLPARSLSSLPTTTCPTSTRRRPAFGRRAPTDSSQLPH